MNWLPVAVLVVLAAVPPVVDPAVAPVVVPVLAAALLEVVVEASSPPPPQPASSSASIPLLNAHLPDCLIAFFKMSPHVGLEAGSPPAPVSWNEQTMRGSVVDSVPRSP